MSQAQNPTAETTQALAVVNEKVVPKFFEEWATEVGMSPQQYWNTVMTTAGLPTHKTLSDGTRVRTAVTFEQQATFALTARNYRLDPMLKQIYAFESKGKIFPIVPIDGWMKIINENPQFDGMEFIDAFETTDKTKIYSITCKMYRKDRKVPIAVTEYFSECSMNTDPWKKWPVRMLRHKATIQCARYAFSIAGIYDEDEKDRIAQTTIVGEAQVQATVDAHMADAGITTDKKAQPQTRLAEQNVVDAEHEPVANAPAEEAPAEPTDWDAVYDELLPGLQVCKNALEHKFFLEENSEQINNMGEHAPQPIVDKWVRAVADQVKKFTPTTPKKKV